MTDLGKLRVSLTKHGAHKVADLIRAFPRDQVLENLSGTYRDINIEESQAIKNLSANQDRELPIIWDQVRNLDDEQVDNLVFLAIIFSHHQLIEVFKAAHTGRMTGRIFRSQFSQNKAYTNLAHIVDELGFCVQHAYEYVDYDLHRLFMDRDQVPLVKELLTLKLVQAQWDQTGSQINEFLRLGFHEVLAVASDEFESWLASDDGIDVYAEVDEAEDTLDFMHPFEFRPGHNPGPRGTRRAKPTRAHRIHLRHNEILDDLYQHLVGIHGDKAVGTENPVSTGNIDIVVHAPGNVTFYELKTSPSIRSCIREAIPQLLEYAYWPDQNRADALVIVSPNRPNEAAKRYMRYLRNTFSIPIHYQMFDLKTKQLGDLI